MNSQFIHLYILHQCVTYNVVQSDITLCKVWEATRLNNKKMVTFSKPILTKDPQGNGPWELKPIILIKQVEAQGLQKGEYHTYKLHMDPYNANSPTYNLAVPFYDTEFIEEWLKFWQHL